MWKDGGNSELLHSSNASLRRVTVFNECSNTAGAYNPIFYISKVCLCTTNCHLYHKDPCPERGLNHSKVVMKKQKQKKPDGRCATCPRWDRWHIRIPNSEDQQKLIRLYRKSGAKTKSDFVRARLLGESFKVITQDPAKEPYLEKLSEIVALAHKIGVLYNEVVKVLNTYHSVATAQQLLGKLETYSQILIRLQQQAVQLTKSFGSREE